MSSYNSSASMLRYNTTFLGFIKTSNQSFLVTYVSRIVFILGIFGNSIILVSIIARRLHNKSVVFIYLWVIAAFDTTSLLSMQVYDELQQIPGYSDVVLTTTVCNVRGFIIYSSSKVSVYTLVAANVFRLYSLCQPLRLKGRMSQRSGALIICLIIIACVFIVHLHFFFGTLEWRRLGRWITTTTSRNASVDVFACAYFFESPSRINIHLVYIAMNAVFYVAIPGVLLLALSIASLVVLQRRYERYKQMTLHCGDNSTHNNSNRTYVSARITVSLLVPISLLHIVLTTPRYILLLKYTNHNSTLHMNTTSLTKYYLWSNVILPLNWGLNFYLQTICSKFFRETMLPCFRRIPRPAHV